MKTNKILLIILLIFKVIISGCGDSDEITNTNNNNNNMEGVVIYEGPFPEPGPVIYQENGIPHTVLAYPGQVIIIFESSTTESEALELILPRNGQVLGKFPRTGYYLVSVTVGSESAFISSFDTVQNVKTIKPNIQPEYMSDTVIVIDGGSHGSQVVSTYMFYGGGYNVVLRQDNNGGGNPVAHMISSHVLLELLNNNGGNSYINISTSGPDPQNWEDLMKIYLNVLLEVPLILRENLVLTVCAGNENFDLTEILARLRSNPEYAELLSNNILIVGATEQVYPPSNDAPGDPDFACMDSVDAPNGSTGTSFAAPRALAILHIIAEQFGLSPKDAMKIAKLCIASNIKGELKKSEALIKAAQWKNASQHDPPNAYNVTSISFTSIGSNTTAVITPHYENVTVAYSVSGTDGYYDSGTEYTSSNGSVSFSIPPGAPGVIDYITVTAILSGKFTSAHYTWDMNLKQYRIK